MEAKLKAKELIDKYYWIFGDGYLGEQHIQCALICVDEILKSNPTKIDCNSSELNYKYWVEVKKEINKL